MTTLFRCISPNFVRQSLRYPRISSASSACKARSFSDKKSNPPAKPDPAPEQSQYYAGSAEEQFGSDAFWAFRNLGRILAWVGYGTVVTGIATLTAFEGAHFWIEQQMRFDQDEDAKAWGWEPELWSGGDKGGGTSASLGLYGRHVVRAAWFALHYVSPFASFAMNSKGNGNGDMYNFVNSDVQSARVYLENVLGKRLNEDGTLRLDRATLELLEQYASVLERIGTRAALVKAGESYSLIYRNRSTSDAALRARYAAKIGNISERIGDGTLALAWWKQSIALLIGQAEENPPKNNTRALLLDLETLNKPNSPGINGDTESGITSTAASGAVTSGWGFELTNHTGEKQDLFNSSGASPSEVASGFDEGVVEIPDFPPRSPLGQRVLVTVLLALSAHYSRRERLSEAKSVQEKAISLIDLMGAQRVLKHGNTQTWAERLHQLFLLHRLSLFHVHHGEVNFTLQKETGTDVLTELHEAASLSEKVATALTEGVLVVGKGDNAYVMSKWLGRDARTLLRDARLTATEAWDLSGVLYRRTAAPDPEKAVECFERALRWAGEPETGSLSAQAWESLLERLQESRRDLNASASANASR